MAKNLWWKMQYRLDYLNSSAIADPAHFTSICKFPHCSWWILAGLCWLILVSNFWLLTPVYSASRLASINTDNGTKMVEGGGGYLCGWMHRLKIRGGGGYNWLFLFCCYTFSIHHFMVSNFFLIHDLPPICFLFLHIFYIYTFRKIPFL